MAKETRAMDLATWAVVLVTMVVGALAAKDYQAEKAAITTEAAGRWETLPESVSVMAHRGGTVVTRQEGEGQVDLTVFSDCECPFCRRMAPLLDEVIARYDGRVTVRFRHLPLVEIHPHAQAAAMAAECAGRQGRFMALHNVIFSQDSLAESDWDALAQEAQVGSAAQFKGCLGSEETRSVVTGDVADARLLGLTGTPSFIVADQLYRGTGPFQAFYEVLDQAIETQRSAHSIAR